jgi:hypothetical protein
LLARVSRSEVDSGAKPRPVQHLAGFQRHPANPLIADQGDVASWAKIIWDAGISGM